MGALKRSCLTLARSTVSSWSIKRSHVGHSDGRPKSSGATLALGFPSERLAVTGTQTFVHYARSRMMSAARLAMSRGGTFALG
jgi:hypothetical protein